MALGDGRMPRLIKAIAVFITVILVVSGKETSTE